MREREMHMKERKEEIIKYLRNYEKIMTKKTKQRVNGEEK